MLRTGVAVLFATALGATAFHASAAAPSASAVIAAASKAMGADNLNSIKIYGVAANYNVGQNNNANGEWPRTNLNDYYRWIDFNAGASRATAQTFAPPVTGPTAVAGRFNQAISPTQNGWAQQSEIWTTPWGFLKGAAKNNATVATEKVGARTMKVVTWNTPQKAPSGKAYKVVGYIGPSNMVERVDTWIENPVLGDMLVRSNYSEYREVDGVKFPAKIVRVSAGQTSFDAQLLGADANPTDLAANITNPPPAGGGAGGPPGGGGGGAAAAPPPSTQLAPDVYKINGAYNAVAVGFKDYVVLFEAGPQNEARALAVIAETKRLFPGKTIKYGVITHHHFDHTGGIVAPVSEGITIVTPAVNKAFLMRALTTPRTLAPDAMSKSGKKPIIEGFTGDKRVFSDANHSLEVHVVKGLPHADGIVIGWLPKEKVLIYADMFNLPTAADPVPNPPVVGTQIFLANLERLGIEPERIVSIHALNPDRLTSMADIRASLGIKK